MGDITTFYSYKGGGGRSMALANVAWALASNGIDVLAVDWDLEAPGLHRYFHPFLADPELVRSDGLMDRLWDYASAAVGGAKETVDIARWADLSDLVVDLEIPARAQGRLSFLCAGRQDDRYSGKVNDFDWKLFYEFLSGRSFIDAFAAWAKSAYHVVLIDSRTGVSDSAGICTVQLPSTIVFTFVYNRQSIEGTAAVARSVRRQRDAVGHAVRMIPVPTRVDEKVAAASARRYAATELHQVVGKDVERTQRDLRLSEIRHRFWCAYEEKLAVFEEDPDERGTLLADMHALAERLAGDHLRGDLRAVAFEPDELARLWRRAAFSDPRLADLEGLSEAPTVEVTAALARWLGEALTRDDERLDWMAALAERCVAVAQEIDRDASAPLGRELGAGGLELARRVARRRANRAHDGELARLLLSRTRSLDEAGLVDEAGPLVEEAAELLADQVGLAVLPLARALEQLARSATATQDVPAIDRFLWQAAQAYARAATADPKLYVDAARVLLRLTSTRNDRGDVEGARQSIALAERHMAAGRSAGIEISPPAMVGKLIEVARAIGRQDRGVERQQAVREAMDMSAALGTDPASLRLKAEALELWTRALLDDGEIDRARETLNRIAQWGPEGLSAIERSILGAEIDHRAGETVKAYETIRDVMATVSVDDLPRTSWMRIFSILNLDGQPVPRRRAKAASGRVQRRVERAMRRTGDEGT